MCMCVCLSAVDSCVIQMGMQKLKRAGVMALPDVQALYL